MNGKGRGLCAQIHPVLAKYPFSPNAAAQATVQEINAVFKPREGAIWQFYEANLQKAIMRQGSQFVANPSAGLNINGAFLGFLNRAAAFSDAAYPAGAADPRLAYSVKPVVSADTESIRLAIDGQTADYAGASAAAAKQFVWPGAAHGLQLAVKFKGGTEFNYPSYDGLWAVFQFVGDADKRQGSLIEMTLRGGKQGRPVLNPATNQPVTVRFEINANPPIFDRGYFSGFGCVAEIARP
jgi:type VI protein secretion system component VasK